MKNASKTLLILFFFLTSISGSMNVCKANNQYSRQISDLRIKFRSLNGTGKAEAGKELATALRTSSPQAALQIAQETMSLASSINYKKGIAELSCLCGILNADLNLYKMAVHYEQESLRLSRSLGLIQNEAVCLASLSIAYDCLGQYDRALEYGYQGAKLSESHGLRKELGDCLNQIGILCYILGKPEIALEYSRKALNIRKEIGDFIGIAYSYENFGIIYNSESNFRKALEMHQKALQIREKLGLQSGIAGSLENIGTAYKGLRQYDRALECYAGSLQIERRLADKKEVAAALSNIGICYSKQGKNKEALKFLSEAIALRQSIGDRRGVANALIKVSNVDESMNRYKLALKFFRRGHDIKDSLFSAKTQQQISEMYYLSRAKEKDREILLLTKDNQIKRQEAYIFTGFIFLFSSIALTSCIGYRRKKRHNLILAQKNLDILLQKDQQERLNSELEAANLDKDKFYSIIAHDLRSPFTALLGISGLLAESVNELSSDEVRSQARLIHESATKIFKLLENLLYWSRLKTGRIQFEPADWPLYDLSEDAASPLEDSYKNKRVSLLNLVNKTENITGDKAMIETVIRNLLSNAVKFTPTGGSVKITSERTDGLLEIRVSDTGVGMSPELIEDLFKSGRRSSSPGTELEKGTGLGLLLCKEFMDLHGGSISAESSEGKGSSFILRLPAGRQCMAQN